MKISARLENSHQSHRTSVSTNDSTQELTIPGKAEGQGSAVNGGELLMLALATCFCNDIYREAAKKGMEITKVSVEVSGEFGAAGEPGRHFTYSAKLEGNATDEELKALLLHTDHVAEIQNTLRTGVAVVLKTA